MKTRPSPCASPAPPVRAIVASIAVAALAACTVGPPYQRPSAPTPSAYKEAAAGWLPAAPADALDRGDWWALFGDVELNGLVAKVEVSNQNVAAAVAAYAQALALVREQRAALFPAVTLDGGASRSGSGSKAVGGRGVGNTLQVSLGASWEPDVWGRLRLAVASAQASAQASQADLAAARLSAQAALATDYFALREADAEAALLRSTVEGYERALKITQNGYDAGITAKTDVLQAETTLANARADLVALIGQRAQLEHAIAVLAGQPPGDFGIAVAEWTMRVPAVPLGVPSTLLERRPDIAAAERAVAAANAQIGIQRSAYFPSFSLSGSYGFTSTRASDLFSASSSLWSIGLSLAQTVFDAGATRARVEGAEAARDAAIARYRQIVLAAFQSVEDQLSTSRVLGEQEALRHRASEAADLTEQQLLNRYRAGQVSYTDVVTAQASALTARRTLVQLVSNRQASAIALIQNLGGGWQASDALPPP
ncbi:MAG TPA: efflux transporter outer membrane subunit [Caldimonas sp.]|nr:efflux transporter outer membrane subunit [Caldimonas sp.]